MERNSVIAERLESTLCDKLPYTSKYSRLIDETRKIEREFMERIENDEELLKQYLSIESMTNKCQLEYESMCFCEGVRTGFKLCMDIFEI